MVYFVTVIFAIVICLLMIWDKTQANARDRQIEEEKKMKLVKAYSRPSGHETDLDSIAPIPLNGPFSVIHKSLTSCVTRDIIGLIKGSKESIKIHMRRITHKIVKNELIATKKRGVDVKILTEISTVDEGDIKPHNDVIKELILEGLDAKYSPDLGYNFAIFDDSYCLYGTLEWTEEMLQGKTKQKVDATLTAYVRTESDMFNLQWIKKR